MRVANSSATYTSLPRSLDSLRIDMMLDFAEIDIRDPIGYGSLGTSLSAQWKDELLAVKIFDGTKMH